jgi:hypothetical protein
MPAPTRSVAIELHENAEAIEAWRSTLPERRRKRLVHPLSNVRAWRRSTAPRQRTTLSIENGAGGPREYIGDLQRDALAHWRSFCACLEALPPEQAVSVEIVALRRAKQ